MDLLRIKKGSNNQITKHFNLTADHFDCQCDSRHCTHTFVYIPTLEFIEKMRVDLGFPMTFNCGYRCPVHNGFVGGGAYSQHMFGLAVDIRAANNDINKIPTIYQYAISELQGTGGVGNYNSFVHIDKREQKARW